MRRKVNAILLEIYACSNGKPHKIVLLMHTLGERGECESERTKEAKQRDRNRGKRIYISYMRITFIYIHNSLIYTREREGDRFKARACLRTRAFVIFINFVSACIFRGCSGRLRNLTWARGLCSSIPTTSLTLLGTAGSNVIIKSRYSLTSQTHLLICSGTQINSVAVVKFT